MMVSKKGRLLIGIFILMIFVCLSAQAGTIDISVTPAGDTVKWRYWGYFGSGTWWDATSNPNQVYHNYSPGSGDSAETSLTFDLSSLTVPAADIVSATLNFDILDIWTQGRDDVSNLNGIGTVNYSEGTGWKLFDITDYLKNTITAGGTSAGFYFSYTGYSGFSFGSADGGDPAFLRILTANGNDDPLPDSPAVPEPTSLLLLGTGLGGIGLAAWSRRK